VRNGESRAQRGHNALLAWVAVPLLISSKQVLAAMFAWDHGLPKRLLPGQLAFGWLAGVALVAMLQLAPRRSQMALLALADAFLSWLLFSDILHIRQFGTPVGASMLRYIDQAFVVRDAITEIVRPRYLLLFLDIPVLVALAVRGPLARDGLGRIRPSRTAAVLVGVALLALGLERLGGPRPEIWSGTVGLVRRYGFLGYHAIDVTSTVGDLVRRKQVTPEMRARVAETLESRAPGRRLGVLDGAAPRANIIVVQVESLQRFVLWREVGGVAVTPALNALAGESLVASAFFHQTAGGRTSDADLAFQCSVLPEASGAAYFQRQDNQFRCLPHLLAEAGYATASFQGALGGLWNVGRMHARLGYARFHSLERYVPDEILGATLSDASFLRQTLPRIEALPEPFLAFVTTFTSHIPFEHGRPLPSNGLSGTLAGRYLEAMHYADEQIGKFVEGIRRSGLLDRSVLVIYGDHDAVPWTPELGRDLGVPGGEAQEFLFLRAVPMLVRLPGGARAGFLDEPLGQLDIAPTLAGIVEVRGETSFVGRAAGSPSPATVTFPLGEATDGKRLHLPPSGSATAQRCISVEDGSELPSGACDELRHRAREEIGLSRMLLEYDLQAVRK
jgi:lipoteichoic acid synthase